MKKIIYTISFLALIIVSCKEEKPVNYAVLSGKVLNKSKKPITIEKNRQSLDTLAFISDDVFRDTLTLAPGNYVLRNGSNRLNIHINNGYNLNMDFDAKDMKNTMVISGIGFETNNYFLNKSKKESEIVGKGREIYLLEEDDYIAKIEKLYETKLALLNASENLHEDFKKKEKRNIGYEYLEKVRVYEVYHSRYSNKPDFKTSEGFFSVLDTLTYDNEEDFLFSNSYNTLLSIYYSDEAFKGIKPEDIGSPSMPMLNAMKTNPNELIRNNMIYESGKMFITMADDLEEYYNAFNTISTNDDHKKEITKIYNKLKKVSRGQPSPTFVHYNNFDGSKTSLIDLKGKYVYVDIWATWCQPCIAEIPSLKKLEKEYKSKKIEFVSISVDKLKDYDKWKDMVEDKELKGVQLFADASFDSDFIKEYSIKAIPRFILIDPDGNIVESNAPRPSEQSLISLFESLAL